MLFVSIMVLMKLSLLDLGKKSEAMSSNFVVVALSETVSLVLFSEKCRFYFLKIHNHMIHNHF